MCKDLHYQVLLLHQNQSINEDYNADKINIRKIRNENRDGDKILRDVRFLLDQENDHYEPKETVSAFNNNYIQYEGVGDKSKKLSIKEYI